MTDILIPGAAPIETPSPTIEPDRTGRATAAGRARRLVRGRPDDPAWVRPALVGLLVTTGVLYVWGLGASGWANSFYSAAVQAGTKNWKAFFFGSSDAANFITVDKSPGSLWVMDLSARLFGVNGWSILVPQALEGVATVGVLYAAVRRWFSPGAALIAGTVMALTPVAALMFRFNNPDALLVLLLTVSAYAMVRALEGGSTRWLVTAFSFVGFAFLAKELQAFLVLPAYGLVYLFAGPPRLGRRIGQLAWASVALLVSAGWWVAIVELTPASSRPYIGGSTNNSVFDVLFGYNGFGRLTGNEKGSVGGGVRAGSRWGATGWGRMFNNEMGGQVSWLLPAALGLLVVGIVARRLLPRTDRTRTALLLWGGWLLVTGITFSLGQGIIHPYYTVALAPAIGAIVGIGVSTWWRRRHEIVARVILGAALAGTAFWSFTLLDRTPNWLPWLPTIVLIAGFAIGAVVLMVPGLRGRLAIAVGGAALIIGLAGPTAYALSTASSTHTGAIPSAGPANGFGFGRPGGRGGAPFSGLRRFAGGANLPPGANLPGSARLGALPGGFGAGNRTLPGGRAGRGGFGGLLNGSTPTAAMVRLLDTNASSFTWVAASIGSNQAAGYQLATGKPVMAIGGFNGSDPTPTLAQFEQYVTAGRIHYFIGGGLRGPGGGARFGAGGAASQGGTSSTSAAISSWVTSHFTAKTVGNVTVYDLSRS
ncbi:MAG: glycosyltransferase family 39 protein [Actinomycetota bacterium]|nr:glycosyltransferase family 39 protein [Actinomycetota bacterium]